MYRALYGDDQLHDPIDDTCRIYGCSSSGALNDAGSLTFTIAPSHPLYKEIVPRGKDVLLYSDDELIFSGFVCETEEEFDGEITVSCRGDLAFLGDVTLRPYSTVYGEQSLVAPSSVDGLFEWYIDQYNEFASRSITVGTNQGSVAFDKNNYVYRASEQRPTVGSEIEQKLLSYGGYLFSRRDGDSIVVDYMSSYITTNTQVIDFGVNLLDYVRTDSVDSTYTAIVPTGASSDGSKVTIESLPDGPYDGLLKIGDRLIDEEGVKRFGYREFSWDGSDASNPENLASVAADKLREECDLSSGIKVNAVDLSLFMDGYKHLKCGHAVRVRSNPHHVDQYMVVCGCDINIDDPGQTVYELGIPSASVAEALKKLNAGIDASVDSVASLSSDVISAAENAILAKNVADAASDDAASAMANAAIAIDNSEKVMKAYVSGELNGSDGLSFIVFTTNDSFSQSELASVSSMTYEGTWVVNESTEGTNVGDSVQIKVTNSSKSSDAYIIGRVTGVPSETSIVVNSVGLVDTGDKGAKGDKGADGKTPIKGTDYFTDSEISGIQSAAASEAADSISIGGRNLAKGTSGELSFVYRPAANASNSCSTFGKVVFDEGLKPGYYTVSFDIMFDGFSAGTGGGFDMRTQGAVDGVWSVVNPFASSTYAGKNFKSEALAGGEYHHEKTTYVSDVSNSVGHKVFDIGLRCDYSDGNGSVYVKNLKVETGNKATDWTPAPEDVSGEISDGLSALAESTNESISSVQSMASGRLDIIEGDIDAIKRSNSTLDGKVGDVASAFDRYKSEQSDYFTIDEEGLTIGRKDGGREAVYAVRLGSEQLTFLHQGVAVAYLNGSMLFVPNEIVSDNLRFGDFSFISRGNGNVCFKYVGGK